MLRIPHLLYEPTGGFDAVLGRPRKFFTIGMAATVFPALFGVLATATFCLTRKSDREVLFNNNGKWQPSITKQQRKPNYRQNDRLNTSVCNFENSKQISL